MRVRSFGGSWRGPLPNNEDALGKREPQEAALQASKGALYIVSDGMGGHRAGEVASRLAVETILDGYYRVPGETTDALRVAVEAANKRILTAAESNEAFAGMGCTVVACVVRDSQATIAHVGDSRIYLAHRGSVRLLTRDHLYVTDVLGLDESQASQNPRRNVLSRALGIRPEIGVDVADVQLHGGDRLLLCTDGLSNVIEHDDVRWLLGGASPRAAARRLLALARLRKTRDNASALVVFVEDTSRSADADRQQCARG
jgi:protein phosphatase